MIPWVVFVVAGILTAVGAVSPAAVAILAPLALGVAARYGISQLLMGLMVVHGAQAGGFSPISIYGVIVNGVVARADLPGNEISLFLASLVFNTLVASVVFVVFGGLPLLKRRASDEDGERRAGEHSPARGAREGTGARSSQGGEATQEEPVKRLTFPLANGVDVDRQVFFRRLLAYGAVVVAVAPVLLWLTLVVPGS